MTDIRLYVDHQRQSGRPVPPYVTITDDHIRAIAERAKEMGLLDAKLQLPAPRDPMPEIKFDAPPFDKPAAPADDEATVDALLRHGMHDGGFTPRGVLAAIRRGEVPGLPSPDEHAALKDEVEHWKNAHAGMVSAEKAVFEDAERLRQELRQLRGRAASAIHDICGMGSNPAFTDTVETLIAYAAQWYSERDTLKSEVERREKEYLADVDRMCKNLARTAEERDAAIARADGMERAGSEQAKRADYAVARDGNAYGSGDYCITFERANGRKPAKPKRTQAQRDAAWLTKLVTWIESRHAIGNHWSLTSLEIARLRKIADRLEKQQ